MKFILLLVLATNLFAGDLIQKRCSQYAQQERRAFGYYFGVDWDVSSSLSQIETESNCREATSNDGYASQGLSQVVWKFWSTQLTKQGINNLNSTSNQLKAQAYVDYVAYKQIQANPKKLWIMYQIYNGGGLVNKEIARAGVADWDKAKSQCRRGDSHFKLKNGTVQSVSNCDINYKYSKDIYSRSLKYQVYSTANSSYLYW